MGISYYNAEKRTEKELEYKRKKEEIKMLEEIIRGTIEDPLKNGLTEEQMFLMNYYGLDIQNIMGKKFDLSDVSQIEYEKSYVTRDELETNRYNELIDIYSALEEFNGKEINKYNDSFHKDIRDWNDYTDGFENDPLIVKKMRNLQMLNKMAHKYEFLFKSILYRKYPQINRDFIENDRKKIVYNIEEMFSYINEDAKKATKYLVGQIGSEQVTKCKKDNVIKYCVNASKWMFRQKSKYLEEILHDLQDINSKYKYGVKDGTFIFDVPEYGQFSIHVGKNNTQRINELRTLYDVNDYEGDYLGNVYILSKADPELLKDVNEAKLTKEDRQRYKIASAGLIERSNQVKNKESILSTLIEGAKDKEKAIAIIKILEESGIEPESVVTKTVLDKGNPEAIKDVIDVIKQNEYGIDLDILTRCKTLLSVSQNKAIDVMEILDKINKLGIDSNIITEYPNFLTVSKSDKIEPIYEMLKQYKINLTNHNMGVAFEGNAQNIKKNMDLVIESGLYEYAQTGVNKFFTSNNKNLNMRINLLKKYNTPLIIENGVKRKINGVFFKTEKDLMETFGITKKQVLDELSKVRGQDLIKDNKYYVEDNNEPITLSDDQQKISSDIFKKLDANKSQDGIVIKIEKYFYSANKVKEQIDDIIEKCDIHNLENEDINEILKVALFKNKNIDQNEIEEVSKKIPDLNREEIAQEENINREGLNNSKAKIEEDAEYNELREMTIGIIEKQQNIEDIEQILGNLKDTRKELKKQIREMEKKINQSIIENDEPNSEVIQDIKNLRQIIQNQKEKRREVKQTIKKYKENKKTMRHSLKQDKKLRDEEIDDLER